MKYNIVIFLVVLFAAGTGSPCFGGAWDLNDVTILYPLPDSKDSVADGLLGFTDPVTGATFIDKNALFYSYIYAPPPSLPDIGMTGSQVLDAFRVVGVRFDPCFRDTFGDPCRQQIRFTWQPIIRNKLMDKWIALDTAIHSFYDLDSLEWASLTGELEGLRAPYIPLVQGKPLQPHPALVSQGLKGEFASKLRLILGKYAGHRKPTRVTYMNVIGGFSSYGLPSEIWDFRMAELGSQGNYFFKPNPLVIKSGVAGESSFESVRNGSDDTNEFNAKLDSGDFVIATLEPGIENLLALIKDSLSFINQTNQVGLVTTYQTALRIQQPAFHLPSTTDCVSCHLSTASVSWFERHLSAVDVIEANRPFKAMWANTKYDLSNVSGAYGSTRSVRQLGYLVNVPAVSNREIFESATVADSLNKNP